jgi:TrpR-related protein YerC/YecD
MMTNQAKNDIQALIDAVLTLKTHREVENFLIDLTTPSELRALVERYKVACLLYRGDLSYRAIAEVTGASTTTITRVARTLKDMPQQGYRLVLDRLERETQTELNNPNSEDKTQ